MRRALGALALGGAAALAYRLWDDQRRLDEFAGQSALITGATSGLGLCLARELVARGARVTICARHPDDLARAQLELGGSVTALPCDVGDPHQVEQMMASLGHLDVLINNAGQIVVGPVETMGLDEFRNCLDVMFWGTVYPTLAVLPAMLSRGTGSILNVTSIGGRMAVPHLLPYCCAKAATVAFSEGLRIELGRRGLTVLTAVPGLMRTGSHLNALFRGRQASEYAWFALAANTPGLTIPARRAARQLLVALARNHAEVRLTMAAELLARAHGLMPGLLADAASLVAGLLPQANGSAGPTLEGRDLAREMPAWLDRLTFLGRVAADQHQQHKGPAALAQN